MQAKTKKIAIGASAFALALAVSAGGTLAYLSKVTESRANNFTFATEGLDARLTEPEWDGIIDYEYPDDPSDDLIPIYDYIDDDDDPETPDVPVYGYEDGDKSKPITDPDEVKDIDYPDRRPRYDSEDPEYDPEYGDEQAQNMVPGRQAGKNPVITNIGITDEWVAAKITFVYAEGTEKAGQPLSLVDFMKVCDVIEIDYDSDKESGNTWVRIGNIDISQTFYYKEIVETKGENVNAKDANSTLPIFTTVTVKTDASMEDIAYLEELGGFAIWIEGYAVQKEAYPDWEAWTTSGAAEFEHTPTADSAADVARPGILPAD